LTSEGSVAEGWPADGVFVSDSVGNAYDGPQVVAGDSDRLLLTWSMARDGGYDVYAQCLDNTGEIPPGWAPDGQPVCALPGSQILESMIADGEGGFIVSWRDFRSGTPNVYVQRIDGSGAIVAGWPADGLQVCSTPGVASLLCSDGAHGAIVAWIDRRAGNQDLYGHHVTSGGTLDLAWPVGGLAVCADSAEQRQLVMAGDGVGGAFLAWTDARDPWTDIYAQHIRGGTALWDADGVSVCAAADFQDRPQIAAVEGSETAVVVWADERFDGLYAQRIGQNGAPTAGWPTDGIPIKVMLNFGYAGISVLADSAGGAYVGWSSYYDNGSGGGFDLYSQRLTSAGMVAPGWPAGGLPIAPGPGDQGNAQWLLLDSGLLVAAWEDGGSAIHLRAAAVAPDGVVPTSFARVATRLASDFVQLTWFGSDRAGQWVDLLRSSAVDPPRPLARLRVEPSGRLEYVDRDVYAGSRYAYWLYSVGLDDAILLDSLTVITPARPRLALGTIRPLPAGSTAVVELALHPSIAADLECIDVSGRRVFETRIEGSESPPQEITLTGLRGVASGVYMLRLSQGDEAATARIVVVR
jgi:hypothetical protein